MESIKKCHVEKCSYMGTNYCNICGYIFCNLELVKNYDNKWRILDYICNSCKLYLEYDHGSYEEIQRDIKKFETCSKIYDCMIL